VHKWNGILTHGISGTAGSTLSISHYPTRTQAHLRFHRKNTVPWNTLRKEVSLISQYEYLTAMNWRCRNLQETTKCTFVHVLTLPSIYHPLRGHFQALEKEYSHIGQSVNRGIFYWTLSLWC
jgi:hypothetical protein